MSRFEKVLYRLKSIPKDFTWSELQLVLRTFGYVERINKGSRRKFIHSSGDVIILHKPHPEKTLKEYAIKQVLEKLKNNRMI